MNSTLISMLQHSLNRATETLSKFVVSLEGNPWDAFEWSESAFEAAAVQRVYGEVLESLKNGVSIDFWLTSAQREVNRFAARGHRSTSVAANLMEAEIMTAWVRALEVLTGAQ